MVTIVWTKYYIYIYMIYIFLYYLLSITQRSSLKYFVQNLDHFKIFFEFSFGTLEDKKWILRFSKIFYFVYLPLILNNLLGFRYICTYVIPLNLHCVYIMSSSLFIPGSSQTTLRVPWTKQIREYWMWMASVLLLSRYWWTLQQKW